jgi:hypothetical protein
MSASLQYPNYESQNITEEFNVLGCNVVYFEERPTFRRNISLPASVYKNKSGKKTAEAGGKLNLHII